MKNTSDTSPSRPNLANLVADDSLDALRKAYQAFESVQLSPTHQNIKERFQAIRTTQMNNKTQITKTRS